MAEGGNHLRPGGGGGPPPKGRLGGGVRGSSLREGVLEGAGVCGEGVRNKGRSVNST